MHTDVTVRTCREGKRKTALDVLNDLPWRGCRGEKEQSMKRTLRGCRGNKEQSRKRTLSYSERIVLGVAIGNIISVIYMVIRSAFD